MSFCVENQKKCEQLSFCASEMRRNVSNCPFVCTKLIISVTNRAFVCPKSEEEKKTDCPLVRIELEEM